MACDGASDALFGAGDAVKVSVFGNPDLNLETRVSEAGSISFPLSRRAHSRWRLELQRP